MNDGNTKETPLAKGGHTRGEIQEENRAEWRPAPILLLSTSWQSGLKKIAPADEHVDGGSVKESNESVCDSII